MKITINTVFNLERHKFEIIITSKEVGDQFPTLWTDKDNNYYEIIYSDAYYDDNLRERHEKNEMLSIDGKKRIHEIGLIYNPVDLKNKKIICKKDLKIKNVR